MTLEAQEWDELRARLLAQVQTPGQYVGGEWNMVRKDPRGVALRFCLAFPDTYSVGMSSIGLHVLYDILNAREDVYAERAFAPWTDMQQALRAHRLPLCSLETSTPLSAFDVVGFSLQYEMTFTNVLDMLELGKVPLLSAERTLDDPIVVAGGSCAFNPEPMADFIDLFIVGDGEERINDLADACIELKRARAATRQEALRFLALRVPNSYAPSLYQEERDAQGRFLGLRPKDGLGAGIPEVIEPAIVCDLDSARAPERPIVPFVETVHDRISIEIMRGCTRGCRFCQAGMIKRPVRFRSPGTILSLCEKQYAATGYSEISLASLSSSDYPDLRRLVKQVSASFAQRRVSVSLPSLRADDQLRDLPGLINAVRKSTLTIAPEAGTDRLRRVINKDISEEDLLRGVEAAFEQGWNHVKLYFMVGLPTEHDEDIAAIADLANRVSRLRRKFGKGPAQVNLSVAPFVPKPHTPFQWEPMASLERLEEIRSLLRSGINSRSVRLRMHRPERSLLEAALARGDRRLGRALLTAHKLGCRFDAWDETFDFVRWKEAIASAGISLEEAACRARSPDEPLPWSHIDSGVSMEFLLQERRRAMQGEITPDCRDGRCQTCGLRICARAREDDALTKSARQ